MPARKIKENIYSVGVVDWDRELFDELIPLPDGTSYNAYVAVGSEKVALIDSVDPSKKDLFLGNLRSLDIPKIDYIISNHAEQDHSGAIPSVLDLYPDAKVVTNPKCKTFLSDLLLIDDEKFIEVGDGERLSLGDKTLEFIYTPWVHWPETMTVYLVEDKILFSCDFFGSHKATSSLYVEDNCKVLQDAKRYYAEIMMPFRIQIRKNIENVTKKDISVICPSHGPIYDEPGLIIDAYKKWISPDVERKVVIPYVSMHGSTQAIADYLVDKLIAADISVVPVNLIKSDIGEYAMELVDAGGLILAAPYVLAGAHPAVVYAAYLTNALRPKLKFVSIINSYGWGGRGNDQLREMLVQIKAEFLNPILVKGYPKGEDFLALDSLVDYISGYEF